MALNTTGLKQALVNAFSEVRRNESETPEQQLDSLCSAIALGVEVFVKSGDVTVNVQTTGSATAQAGTGTGKIQ